MLTETYPDGETVTNTYTGQDWLSGVSTSQGNTTLLGSVSYAGIGGAYGAITGATWNSGPPNGYTYSATYDALGRASDIKVSGTNQVLFEQTRNFDPAGNVSSANNTLPGGRVTSRVLY